PLPQFMDCSGDLAGTFPSSGEFRHTLSDITASLGSPSHHVADVITPPQPTIRLDGKFAYGDLSKDLEDERVTAYLSDCAQWQEIGDDLTNSDGRSVINLD